MVYFAKSIHSERRNTMNKYRDFDNYLKENPTTDGYFGEYGGSYQAEELIEAFKEADDA